MTTDSPALQAALGQAAALFGTAARHPRTGGATSLACLAAEAALGAVPVWPAESDAFPDDPDALITLALQTLGSLDAHDFADSRVLAAVERGQEALRGPL